MGPEGHHQDFKMGLFSSKLSDFPGQFQRFFPKGCRLGTNIDSEVVNQMLAFQSKDVGVLSH
jgi:hypothetical protein